MASAFQPLVLIADDCSEWPTQGTTPPPRLLIVDDEAEVRELFTRLLRSEGYAVHAVATADAGLDAVAEWRPDAILLDYFMPVVNGIGFLYRLRAHESASRTPVAVITGASDVEVRFPRNAPHSELRCTSSRSDVTVYAKWRARC
jgi:CheY-like chemotaxis protein